MEKFFELGFNMGRFLIAGPYEVFNNLRKRLNDEARATATTIFYEGAEAGYKERGHGN